MAQNTYRSKSKKNSKKGRSKVSLKIPLLQDKRFQLTFGFLLIAISVFFLISFVSYLFTFKADQSVVEAFNNSTLKESGLEAQNWGRLFGALVSYFFIYKLFGVASLILAPLLFLIGYRIVSGSSIVPIGRATVFSVFVLLWISTLFGYLTFRTDGSAEWGFLGGGFGFEFAVLLESIVGWGTFIVLAFTILVFIIFFFNITSLFKTAVSTNQQGDSSESAADVHIENSADIEAEAWKVTGTDDGLAEENASEDQKPDQQDLEVELKTEVKEKKESKPPVLELELEEQVPVKETPKKEEPSFTVEEKVDHEKYSDKLENYDPTLDLSSYKYPNLDLLNNPPADRVQVTKEELEQNKDRIIETLINFKIGISSIKATIGPTVTLYEIVPEAGVKISKIKNLEDDIALSLAALGIRIIAPIPGKGTIGIEVPNKNREVVYMKSVLSTDKFTSSKFELPVVLGKTISNEVMTVDLTKMPHMLMAGATGQGKSVALNVLLTSLIYKKHPSQLKLVLVDPKKVELSLFNKLERHFLAKLPDAEDAIITDVKQVVKTLNSLCLEMDNRYNLLKEAGSRNLKEYNAKFINRRLNPEKGHRFLPYIVLVIDELADLMMVSGKEVETPIARLAQLARAIGIHLVVATQRPSVNVITGIIKANFPARMSFRVTSQIDSRTILDSGGAERLVGMGDMLLSQGSDIVRLQCPFVDTPEVEGICDFIGAQRGYEASYELPEIEEDDSGSKNMDLSDRDVLFEEAAKLIVSHQQGSTSLIQRKMKLGYNRAGRLIDQLEAAGIVGPFEGSKAREVLIQDEHTLEQLLDSLD